MNRVLGIMILCYGLFVLYVVAGGLRWLRNLTGTLNGWTKCPGCRDTWWGKEAGLILYKPQNGEPVRQASFSLCESCLANPGLLDADEICRNVSKEGWSDRRVQAIREAVLSFQSGGGNLRRL
ncbi:MAG: hypothetical protein WC528_02710 [Patescibacteria group bacterium]